LSVWSYNIAGVPDGVHVPLGDGVGVPVTVGVNVDVAVGVGVGQVIGRYVMPKPGDKPPVLHSN
jgi:hypothetical protein